MKSTLKVFAVAVLVLGVSGAVGAQAPANTGASANVVAGVDTRWQVSLDGLTWIQALQVQNPPGVWEPNTSLYSWISATSSGSGGGGNYYFRMFFDLSAYDVSNVSMTFRCAVDNEAAPGQGYFSLNGGVYGGTCGSGGTTNFKFAGTQTVNSGFVGGVNELKFHVTGDAITDGLVVGDIAVSGPAAVPEPASIALLATGLVGVYGATRRRQNSLKS